MAPVFAALLDGAEIQHSAQARLGPAPSRMSTAYCSAAGMMPQQGYPGGMPPQQAPMGAYGQPPMGYGGQQPRPQVQGKADSPACHVNTQLLMPAPCCLWHEQRIGLLHLAAHKGLLHVRVEHPAAGIPARARHGRAGASRGCTAPHAAPNAADSSACASAECADGSLRSACYTWRRCCWCVCKCLDRAHCP